MKKNIALLTGGYSDEYAISLQTAAQIQKHLDPAKFTLYLIEITSNSWFYTTPDQAIIEVNKHDFSLQIDKQHICFDCAFIAIHGSPAEDGLLQRKFDLLNIPYTCCDAACSALTFNKADCNAVVAKAGLQIAKSVLLLNNSSDNTKDILAKLSLPLFVKPNNGGSSIGLSRVDTEDDLAPALKRAFKADTSVLIEELIAGREFTCGVWKVKGKTKVFPITEIILPKNEIFDYANKYTSGKAAEITPAELDAAMVQNIEAKLIKIYEALGCKGVVRIDFILKEPHLDFYFLEINTIPGQTETSFIPQQVKAMGCSLPDFYTALLEETMS